MGSTPARQSDATSRVVVAVSIKVNMVVGVNNKEGRMNIGHLLNLVKRAVRSIVVAVACIGCWCGTPLARVYRAAFIFPATRLVG